MFTRSAALHRRRETLRTPPPAPISHPGVRFWEWAVLKHTPRAEGAGGPNFAFFKGKKAKWLGQKAPGQA